MAIRNAFTDRVSVNFEDIKKCAEEALANTHMKTETGQAVRDDKGQPLDDPNAARHRIGELHTALDKRVSEQIERVKPSSDLGSLQEDIKRLRVLESAHAYLSVDNPHNGVGKAIFEEAMKGFSPTGNALSSTRHNLALSRAVSDEQPRSAFEVKAEF